MTHDTQRPFLVQAGDIVVRAAGTQFNVRARDAQDVEVIVTESKVDVKSTATSTRDAHAPDGPATCPVSIAYRLMAG